MDAEGTGESIAGNFKSIDCIKQDNLKNKTELVSCVRESDEDPPGNVTEEFASFIDAIKNENTCLQFQEDESSETSTFFRMSSKKKTPDLNDSFCGFADPCVMPSKHPESFGANNKESIDMPLNGIEDNHNYIEETSITQKEIVHNIKPFTKPITASNENIEVSNLKFLYEELYTQCKSTPENHGNHDLSIPDVQPLLHMAIMTMNNLKTCEEELLEEKNQCEKNQVEMLHRLIALLKERVPANGADKPESFKSLRQTTAKQLQTNLSQRIKKNKNTFRGFYSSKPQLRDRLGIITLDLEKLFSSSPPSSPPSSPTHDESADCNDENLFSPLSAENSISKLNFVFKPVSSLLPTLGTLNLSVPEVPKINKNVDKVNKVVQIKRKTKKYKRRKYTKFTKKKKHIGSQKGRWGVQRKQSKKDKKLKMKVVKRKEVKRGNKKINVIKSVSETSKLEANSEGKINPKLSNLRRCTTRRAAMAYKDDSDFKLSNMFGANSRVTFRGITDGALSPKILNDSSAKNSNSQDKASVSASEKPNRSLSMRGIKRKLSTASENIKMKRESMNDIPKLIPGRLKSLHHNPQVTNVINKRVHRVQPIGQVKPSPIQNHANGLDQKQLPSLSTSSPNSVNVSNEINKSVSQSNKLSSEFLASNIETKLYYPVHPFISHDLPVHFIPIDQNKVPHFLPLYSPIFGAKNSNQIYPSFIRTRPSAEKYSPPEYILSKGIASKSIPHCSFAYNKVRGAILPGIASTSKCPLIPEMNTSKTLKTQTIHDQHFKLVSEANKFSTQTTKMNSIIVKKQAKSHLQESLKTPMVTINATVSAQQKIHKCLKCDFRTPKLGVLKRHELSHSKASNKDVIQISEVPKCTPARRSKISSAKTSSMRLGNKLKATSSFLVSKDKSPSLKIEKAKSLKEFDGEVNNFSGFVDSTVNGSFYKRFPSVTITPLYGIE